MSGERLIKISQLPEKTNISSLDYMVLEDSEDTKKIQMNVFEEFMNNYIDTQVGIVSDNIQKQMDSVTKLMNKISEGESARETAESDRVNAEKNRNTIFDNWTATMKSYSDAESTRSDTFDNWTATMQNYDIAESARVDAENKRVTAESARVDAENKRVTAESARVDAENKRVTAESNRVKTESARVDAESARQSGYLDMTNYFSSVRDFVEHRSNTGLSKIATSSNQYFDLFDITFIKGDTGYDKDKWYSCLLHIYEIGSDTEKSGFIFGKFKLTTGNDGSFSSIEYKLYANSISNINIDDITIIQSKSGDNIVISIYYKADIGSIVECHRIEDNLTVFDLSLLDAIVNDQVLPSSTLPAGNKLSFSDISELQIENINAGSAEMHMITLMEQLKVVRKEMGEIKPINYYPVGIIVDTTTNTNPATLFGGGTWVNLFDGPITQKITNSEGQVISTVTIYKWKRTK